MKKLVMYNGNKETYYACADPKVLVPGRVYEVESQYDRRFQTDYRLKGLEGDFNALWFYEISSMKTYFAIGNKIPEVGKHCFCIQIYSEKGKNTIRKPIITSKVEWIELIGKNTYKVITQNNIYIIVVTA